MMKDDKLKKGQIRIIVIATGFPEGGPSFLGRGFFLLSPGSQKMRHPPR
jgi:hypothetical protein